MPINIINTRDIHQYSVKYVKSDEKQDNTQDIWYIYITEYVHNNSYLFSKLIGFKEELVKLQMHKWISIIRDDYDYLVIINKNKLSLISEQPNREPMILDIFTNVQHYKTVNTDMLTFKC